MDTTPSQQHSMARLCQIGDEHLASKRFPDALEWFGVAACRNPFEPAGYRQLVGRAVAENVASGY